MLFPIHSSLRTRVWAGLLCLSLLACGGGSGGNTNSATPVSTPAPVAAPPPAPTASASSTLGLSLPRQGLNASELGVIVAEGDALSEAIAACYQAARGVPAANIIRVKVDTSSPTISATAFSGLKADVDAKLPAGVQASLVTWTAPSRVVDSCAMSITSALAFGYNSKYCGGCASTASSAYFDSESRQPWTDLRIRPAMMLGATSLAAAKALIDRGVQSDGSLPSGDGYLINTNDAARSIRFSDFNALPAAWAGRLALNYINNSLGPDSANSISGKNGLLFYFTGLANVPNLSSNSFRPGAVADHLTSYAGLLPTSSQMSALAWLDAGATASYGTVEEPCNFSNKFPKVSTLIDQYYRGASLIEAYWKAVEWPGQGLFVGEPLARPFPDNPSFVLQGNQYQISTRALRPNSSYALDYRVGTAGSWVRLASFSTGAVPTQNLSAPLPPADATQLRWLGPCPSDAKQLCTLSSS